VPKLLNLIVACSENRVIGRDGKLPWRIPEDAQFLREKTAGQICICGRICFETWPRATQDGRRAIVLTSRPLTGSPNLPAERSHERQRVEGERPEAERNLFTVHSLAAALARAETLPGEVFVCGGQQIFDEALALSQPIRLYLTLIHAEVEGDRFFPEWRQMPWRETARRESADANYRYTFLTLERL
jgi:dihydrofolate reductase